MWEEESGDRRRLNGSCRNKGGEEASIMGRELILGAREVVGKMLSAIEMVACQCLG